MKTRNLVLSLAMAGALFGTTGAIANEEQPWHVTAQFGYYNLDEKRLTDEGNAYWNIGFGRFFGNNFSLDFEYDQYGGDFRAHNEAVPGSTYDEWNLSNWGVMARYHFGDDQIRPFIAAGLGIQNHRSVLHEGRDPSISLGGGIRAQIDKHISGTAQILHRWDTDDKSIPAKSHFNDWIFSLGLSFDFGGRAAPPPPPPPPEPPPPPPNPDLDGDGVLNERDKCPNTRPGAVVDLDGCEVEAVIELEGVHFDFDKATLRPEAKKILDEAAALLNKQERVVVEVAGHTDSKGSEEYNQGLSERRAAAVKQYLTAQGIKATRLTAMGYGESRPVASNDTEAGRAENRRVELVVLDR